MKIWQPQKGWHPIKNLKQKYEHSQDINDSFKDLTFSNINVSTIIILAFKAVILQLKIDFNAQLRPRDINLLLTVTKAQFYEIVRIVKLISQIFKTRNNEYGHRRLHVKTTFHLEKYHNYMQQLVQRQIVLTFCMII